MLIPSSGDCTKITFTTIAYDHNDRVRIPLAQVKLRTSPLMMKVETVPSKSAGGNYGRSRKWNRELAAELISNIYVANISDNTQMLLTFHFTVNWQCLLKSHRGWN